MISPSKLSLNDLRDMAHANSREKGFWDECNNQPMDLIARLGLVMTEVAEAIECVRNSDMGSRTRVDGKPEGLPSELADSIIRLLDIAGGLNVDIDMAVRVKMAWNETRERMHGKSA